MKEKSIGDLAIEAVGVARDIDSDDQVCANIYSILDQVVADLNNDIDVLRNAVTLAAIGIILASNAQR